MNNTFVMYMASLFSINHPSQEALIASIKMGKINVLTKYLDFINIFFSDFATELLEHTSINNHPIKLIKGQQSSYGPIYSLEPIEIKTLKPYIKSNLANRFIRLFKCPAGVLILFVGKKNGCL